MNDFRDRSDQSPEELRRQNRALNAPAVVLWLIVALVAIHAVRQGIDPRLDRWVLFTFGFVPLRFSAPQAVFPGPWWSFITHALLHGDWIHLMINSAWMLIFGSVLARRLGSARFLLISAVTAAAGAAANLAWYWGGELTILVGASGAISGQLAGAVRLIFAEGGTLMSLSEQRFDRVRALSLG
jgi:membrane associated rhomboid family serine protease